MRFEYGSQAILLIFLFLGIIAFPCILVARIGYRMINKLGQFPSKTPEIQMSIFLKLVIVEVISFSFLYGFYTFMLYLSEK